MGFLSVGLITSIFPIILLLLSQYYCTILYTTNSAYWRYITLNLKRNMENETIEVLTYLAKMGYHYQNEKAFIQSSKDDKKLLWTIIGDIIRPLEPTSLRNIAVSESHAVGDEIDRHRQSLPFMQNLCIMKQIFKKLDISFSLMTFMKSTSKDVIPMMYKLIIYAKYYHGMAHTHEAKLIDMKQLQKTLLQKKAQLQILKAEQQTIKASKLRDRPIFEQRQQELKILQEQLKNIKTYNINLATSCVQAQRKRRQNEGELRIKESKIKQKELDIIDQSKLLADVSPDIKKQKIRKEQLVQEQRKKNDELERLFIEKNSKIRDKVGDVKKKYQPSCAKLNKLRQLDQEWTNLKIKSEHQQQRLYRQRQQRQYLQTDFSQKTNQNSQLFIRSVDIRQKCREMTQRFNQAKIHYNILQKETAHLEEGNTKLQNMGLKIQAELKKLQEKTELTYQQKEATIQAITIDMHKWSDNVERILLEITEPFKKKYS